MITRDDVIKSAKLAKLSLDETSIEKFTEQLKNILQYVEKLNELDTKNISATAHAVKSQTLYREDTVNQLKVIDKVLEQAPASESGLFIVPRVI